MSQALETRTVEQPEHFGIDLGSESGDGSPLVLCLDQRAGALARAAVANSRDILRLELPHVPRADYLDPTKVVREGRGGIEVSDTDETEHFYTTRLQHAGVLYTAFDAYSRLHSPGETRKRLTGYVDRLGELALNIAEHSERQIPGYMKLFSPTLWLSERSIRFLSGYNLVEYFQALGGLESRPVIRAVPKTKQ